MTDSNNNDLSTGENILEKNDINCKYYDKDFYKTASLRVSFLLLLVSIFRVSPASSINYKNLFRLLNRTKFTLMFWLYKKPGILKI